MALSTGKVAGLLGAVLLIALLAFAAGFLLGLSTAADFRATADSPPSMGAPPSGSAAGGIDGGPTPAGDTAANPATATGAAVDSDGGESADEADPETSGPPQAQDEADGSAAAKDGEGKDDEGPSGYTVVSGEHAVEARAIAAAKRLSDAGFDAQVVASEESDAPWFRVVVGGFDSLARAREAAMQIRTEIGVDALVGPPPPQAANAEADG